MRALALSLCIPGLVVVGSCVTPPAFPCTDDSVCVLNNIQGECNVPTQTCVYPGPECPSMRRDAHGNCVDVIGMSTTSASESASASASMSSTTSQTPDPSGNESTNSVPDTTGASAESTSTGVAQECTGGTDNITSQGVVGASTVFSGYPPALSADGDLATSWFSTGPEGTGKDQPSVYTWTLLEERCIARVFMSGNGLHSNPAFRELYGFDSVIVRIFDSDNDVVFEEERELANTPDPDVTVMTGGVMGSRVLLELYGHENEDCGGFSELQVLGE